MQNFAGTLPAKELFNFSTVILVGPLSAGDFSRGEVEKSRKEGVENIVELWKQALSIAELFTPTRQPLYQLEIEIGDGNIFTLATFPRPNGQPQYYIIPQFHNHQSSCAASRCRASYISAGFPVKPGGLSFARLSRRCWL